MQAGLDNLLIRKTYGQDAIRYLRCRSCQSEFSERKGSALWNSKVSEEKAEAVAAHLAEGCSQAATTRLVKVDPSVVRRLNQRLGRHGQVFHAIHAQQIKVKALQADVGFHAQRRMSKLLNGAKAGEWSRWRYAWLTGRKNSPNSA